MIGKGAELWAQPLPVRTWVVHMDLFYRKNLGKRNDQPTTTGCFQCFLIPWRCPFPTTATTELCSVAILRSVDDMYLLESDQQSDKNLCKRTKSPKLQLNNRFPKDALYRCMRFLVRLLCHCFY